MECKKSNVILIGMPGAGKSTLGVLLAKALGLNFIDTDILIQQKKQQLLQDIIDREGIDAFLSIEEQVLLSFKAENSIVATGGSAVYSDKAMKHLKTTGMSIYLHIDYTETEKRVTNITSRGIVLKHEQSLKDAYDDRLPLYKKYADITIDCTGQSIERSLTEIISALNQENKNLEKYFCRQTL